MPVPSGDEGVAVPVPSHGHTLHGDEQDGPDPSVLAEQRREEAKRFVDGTIADGLAENRVRNGIVDEYFGQLEDQLKANTAHPPNFFPGDDVAKTLKRSVLEGAEAYGKTGNPYSAGEVPEYDAKERATEFTNPSAALERTHPGAGGGTLQMQRLAHQASQLRDFANGKFGQGIIALVEIRQAGDGRFVSAALVRSSGSKPFDEYVIASAPVAVGKLPAPPKQGVGIHGEGLRSVWSFEGKVKYKTKLDKHLTMRDALGIAATDLLTAGSGSVTFDEVTGSMEAVDITHPTFSCRVHLLRVY